MLSSTTVSVIILGNLTHHLSNISATLFLALLLNLFYFFSSFYFNLQYHHLPNCSDEKLRSHLWFSLTLLTSPHMSNQIAGQLYVPTQHLFFIIIIFLFLAVLCLRFCARAFSSCAKWGPLFIAMRGPLTIVASLVAEHRLQTRRLSSCGSRA